MGLLKRTAAGCSVAALLLIPGVALADGDDDTDTVIAAAEATEEESAEAEEESAEEEGSAQTDSADADNVDAEKAEEKENPAEQSESDEETQNDSGAFASKSVKTWDGVSIEIEGIAPFGITVTHSLSDEDSEKLDDFLFSGEELSADDFNKLAKDMKLVNIDDADGKKAEAIEKFRSYNEGQNISPEEFRSLITASDSAPDLSELHGMVSVRISTTGGSMSKQVYDGNPGVVSGTAEGESFTIYVSFPTVGNEDNEMTLPLPLQFDGEWSAGSRVLLTPSWTDPTLLRFQELDGKTISADEFFTLMNDMGVATGSIPAPAQAYGKHTVTLTDGFDAPYSTFTVAYPEKSTGSTDAPKNETATGAQPQAGGNAAGNSGTANTGNTSSANGTQNTQVASTGSQSAPVYEVVTPPTRSFASFVAQYNPASVRPVAPAAPANAAPVNNAPSAQTDKADDKAEAPKLPVTGSDRSDKSAADIADAADNADESVLAGASSRAAIFALAACVGFGIIAAASVIAVRRIMK